MHTPVRAVDGKRAFRRTDVCARRICRKTHGRGRRNDGKRSGQKRVIPDRAGRHQHGCRRLPEVGDCRSWVPSPVAPRGRAIQCKMHDGRSSCRRRKSSAREPFFCGSDASRDRHQEADEPADRAESCVRRLRSAAICAPCRRLFVATRVAPTKKRFAGCRKRQGAACGVRRATTYFNSTRSMRNANAPSGCPAVNAMARTRARSAPLKPFSGTRISFHSGPASKVCMLGICCEPWNSIS